MSTIDRRGLTVGSSTPAVIVVANAPPTNPTIGGQWFDTSSGILYTWIVDDDSGQWVELSLDGFGAFEGVVCIEFVIDGGGVGIVPGVQGDLEIGFPCTIERWSVLGDQPGSIVIDIWKDAYTNFPPTVADRITGSAKPTVTAARSAQSSVLTGWTTAVAAGDALRFNVDSVSGFERVTLSLKATRN